MQMKEIKTIFEQIVLGEPSGSELVDALEQRLVPLIPSMLDALLNDTEEMKTLANRSSMHANGFVKIELHQFLKYKLRLHYFSLSAEEAIHDHTWNFASAILAGKLRSERFAVVRSNTPDSIYLKRYVYRPRVGKGNTVLIKLHGYANLKSVGIDTYAAGSSYWLDGSVPHRVLATSKQCVTLVITTDRKRATNYIFSFKAFPKELEVKSISLEQLEDALNVIRKLVKS